MKRIKIKFNNRVFDGRWQWLYFLILDINDFLYNPFDFYIEDNCTIQNFKVDITNWNRQSSKYIIIEELRKLTEQQLQNK